MENIVQMLLMFLLPTGGIAGVLGWLLRGRQRKNSFLSELQGSIDLLATKNRELMARLLEVKEQNVELIMNQGALKAELDELRKENKALYDFLEELGQKFEKPTRRKKTNETTV